MLYRRLGKVQLEQSRNWLLHFWIPKLEPELDSSADGNKKIDKLW